MAKTTFSPYLTKVLQMDRFDWELENKIYGLDDDDVYAAYEVLSEKKKAEGLTQTEEAVLGYCEYELFPCVYSDKEYDFDDCYEDEDEAWDEDEDEDEDEDDEEEEEDEDDYEPETDPR